MSTEPRRRAQSCTTACRDRHLLVALRAPQGRHRERLLRNASRFLSVYPIGKDTTHTLAGHGDAAPEGYVHSHEADLRQNPCQTHGVSVARDLDHQGRELHARGSLRESQRGSRRGDALQGVLRERGVRGHEHGGEAQAGVGVAGSGDQGRGSRAESQDEDPFGGGEGAEAPLVAS